jgi:hypothetical protein
MGFMAENYGERLFERYIVARGHAVLAREPDLGNGKRPDFLIQAGRDEIVVEVKTFDPPLTGRRGRLSAVRSRIAKAAKQLRDIEGRAVVVVLTSPPGSSVPLVPMDIVEAMYGDLTFDDRRNRHVLGRNAKLRIDEPNGTSHGDHPCLSAIAVMCSATVTDRRAVTWMRDHGTRCPTILDSLLGGLDHAEGQAAADEHVIHLDVFHTVSRSAHPLPYTAFNGPCDGRWGETSPGHYGPLPSCQTDSTSTAWTAAGR